MIGFIAQINFVQGALRGCLGSVMCLQGLQIVDLLDKIEDFSCMHAPRIS